MKYRILGAERQSGDDVDMIIEAPTRGAAEAKAHRMNVLIERVEVLLEPPSATGHVPTQPVASDPNWAAALVVLLLVGAAVYWSYAGQGPEQSSA